VTATLVGSDAVGQQREFAQVTTIQPPKGHRIEGALLADVDGDGRDDLLVTRSRKRRDERTLSIHLRRASTAAASTCTSSPRRVRVYPRAGST